MAISFPEDLDTLVNPSSTDTLDSPSHAGQHSDVNDAVEALEAKVGADSSAVTSSHDYKLGGVTGTDKASSLTGTETLTNKTLSTGSDIDTNVDVVEVLKKIYPVGVIYSSTVSTNPATLFGFGTWEAYGEGRVLVGKAGSGTFNTAGATGGAETHTLTSAQMPTHTHTQDAHTHNITFSATTTPSTFGAVTAGGGQYGASGEVDTGARYLVNSNTTATNQNTGGGEAHSNLQPYVVVYIFRRTV